MTTKMMCPHCGEMVGTRNHLTVPHPLETDQRAVCPGSGQVPRNAESDRRVLWNGEPNPHLAG